jgi:predicted dinucleotide-binding enzyme
MGADTRIGTIGIIGAGHLGQALARTARRAGRKVVIANSRGAGVLVAQQAPDGAVLGRNLVRLP